MKGTPRLTVDMADAAALRRHLLACDQAFVPPLSHRVDIEDYVAKLHGRATRFEAWDDDVLVGLVAAYCNDLAGGCAHITSVSVSEAWRGTGMGSELVARCIRHATRMGFGRIELEVAETSAEALRLYARQGFRVVSHNGDRIGMSLVLEEEQVVSTRNFNDEIKDAAGHRYAYGFDFDVMHPLMVRSFEPFFRPGKLLELGSYKGDFTRRLLARFDDVTCVEASDEALEEARQKLGDAATWVNDTFEAVSLPDRYDNIVMTHVLEHLDDPVGVLRRVNEEWLAPGGRFFLACPNANAPSRQIAVKMGLISHNAAVTPAEAEHGHRCTYSLDTLERDARAAGLRVVHRSGIFFKALANFQWDRLLQTDIVSDAYLEGCFELGQVYPDLCSSVFLVCERGG